MKYVFFFFVTFGLFSQNSEDDITKLNNQLSNFQFKFTQLMKTRGTLNYEPQNIDLSILQKHLLYYNNPKMDGQLSTILFYFQQNDTLYHWIIDHKGIAHWDTTISQPKIFSELNRELKNEYTRYNTRGSKVRITKKSQENLNSVKESITAQLFTEQSVAILQNYNHWIIVPAHEIAAIPFYSLQPFKDKDEFIIDHHVISIAHSFDELLNKVICYAQKENMFDFEFDHNLKAIKLPFKNPYIIGNPSYEGCSGAFNNLPGAEIEVKKLSENLKINAFIGSEVNKSHFLRNSKNSNFIYIATHGIADDEDPMHASYLVFGTNDDNNCEKLTATEAQNLKFEPETLIVLSACQTGLGKPLDAGIIGIGRAFIKAGASNVVMSLWDVEDKATQELMEYFYEELLKPQHFLPASGLRNAMLKYKTINPNPSAWSAFITMGTPVATKSYYYN